MTDYVHDVRHRYSYELRPDAQLDAALRALALQLEDDDLLPAGSATAPRFQPHLTFLRADRAEPAIVDELARRIALDPVLELDTTGEFGSGRIAWFGIARARLLHATRAWLVEALGGEARVDPLALRREPWVPHVTVAYSVDEPHRAAVRARLAAVTPLAGSWRVAQAWDLDVRPTHLEHETPITPAR